MIENLYVPSNDNAKTCLTEDTIRNKEINDLISRKKKKIQQLEVVNDVSERGVVLANSYIHLTTSEPDLL